MRKLFCAMRAGTGFGELRQEIVHRAEAKRQAAPQRKVHATANRHREGIAPTRHGEGPRAGMSHAKQVLSKRHETAEIAEINLRTEHVGEQAGGVCASAADLPDVIAAKFARESIPSPGVIREGGRAPVHAEVRKTGR